jgi:hypothetical protein
MTATHDGRMTKTAPPAAGGLARCAISAALLAFALAGCGTSGEDLAARAMVSPGKYQFHNCKMLTGLTQSYRARITELQQLMDRAAQGPGGQAVGTLAYRNEYLQMRGELREVQVAMAEKNCDSEAASTSQRSVY